jgi:sarcosine oxidase subunit beta
VSEPRSPDILIIGAGVIGCAIALALARRGLNTLNVDALPAAGYGSTSHSSAIIRPFYSHVTSCAIAHESRSRWCNWRDFLDCADERGTAQYHETGGLVLVREGARDEYAENIQVLDTVGVEYRYLTGAEVLAMYPGICLDGFGPPRRMSDGGFGLPAGGRIDGGIFIPAAGYVSDPQLAAHNIQTAAISRGARFRFDARICEVLREANRVRGVRLDNDETIAAPVIVNAAGPHSAVVNGLAGIALDIQTRPHRHEVAYVKAPPGYVEHGNGFIIDLDAGIYQRPDRDDIAIGSADPACDPPDLVDPDSYNPELTEQWTLQVHRAAQRFPELGIENTARGMVGLYDVSDDWIPLYDRSDLEGFYLAIGTSGNQFKNAPVVGDIMAEIVTATENGCDHDSKPVELHLPHLDRSVDLSFYSRHRKLQKTRSVMA